MRPCEGAPGGRPSWPPGWLTLQAGTGRVSNCHCIILYYPKSAAHIVGSCSGGPLGRPLETPGPSPPVRWAEGTRGRFVGAGKTLPKNALFVVVFWFWPWPWPWPWPALALPLALALPWPWPSGPDPGPGPGPGPRPWPSPGPGVGLTSVCCNSVPGHARCGGPQPDLTLARHPTLPPSRQAKLSATPALFPALCPTQAVHCVFFRGLSPCTPTKPRCLCLCLAHPPIAPSRKPKLSSRTLPRFRLLQLCAWSTNLVEVPKKGMSADSCDAL